MDGAGGGELVKSTEKGEGFFTNLWENAQKAAEDAQKKAMEVSPMALYLIKTTPQKRVVFYLVSNRACVCCIAYMFAAIVAVRHVMQPESI